MRRLEVNDYGSCKSAVALTPYLFYSSCITPLLFYIRLSIVYLKPIYTNSKLKQIYQE